jgi:CHAT domain-containing protein/tetratricopeptide (TPR) repeat protein
VVGWRLRSRTVFILFASFSVCVGCISFWALRPQLQRLDEVGKHADVLARAPAPAAPAPAWSPGQTTSVESCDTSLGQIDTDSAFAGVFVGTISDGQGFVDVQVKIRRDGNVVRGSYWRAAVCGTVSGEVKGNQFLFAWNWAGNAGRGIASLSGEGFKGTAGFNQLVEGAGTFVLFRLKPPEDLEALNRQVTQLRQAAKYVEATDVAKRALAQAERQFGPDQLGISLALSTLATLYHDQGRYAEAESLFKRALTVNEKALGPDHPYVGIYLNNLALLYKEQGRFTEAEPLFKRALAIHEKALGPDHLSIGTDANNLGLLYTAQSRYAEAEPLFKRALAIAEKAQGPEHAGAATAISNLSQLYYLQGRYAEAEPLFKRALAIHEKVLGPDHREVGKDVNNLATLYNSEGRYREAEPLFERSLAIFEKALGPDHPDVGLLFNNLAELHRLQGRYSEAEPLYKRALAIREKALGPNHPDVGQTLNNLALLYETQGRYAEAEPLLKRMLAIEEKAFGPDHPDVGMGLSNLAELYGSQRRYAEAESLFKRALAILEKALGPDHPNVATELNYLGLLSVAQGHYDEPEPLYMRALGIDEKALGPNHPAVGRDLSNRASLYVAQTRYSEAEPLFKRALAIAETALGPDHPDISMLLNNLGGLYFLQGNWAGATDYWRRGTNGIVRRVQRGAVTVEAPTGKQKSEAARLSWQFQNLVRAAYRLALDQHTDMRALGEMFQTVQWAQSSEAAESLAQMGARGAKGDPKLADLVRDRQDLVAEWQRRDQLRSASIAQSPEKRDVQAEAENVARLASIDGRIADIDKRLVADFPDFAALASAAPISIEEVQAHLTADEALLVFLDAPDLKPTPEGTLWAPEETFIWAVTKTSVRWVRSDVGTMGLAREVAALRCGLDYEGSWADSHCSDLLKIAYTHDDHKFGKPLPFDLVRAYQLYTELFGQVEDLIKGKHLLIVPSGPLTQLPFQVLVTEAPKVARPSNFADYRNVSWLVRKHAITVLPAVSSLKALRELAKQSHASKPYIGFGNPLLDGQPAKYEEDGPAAKLAREKRCDPMLRQRVASVPGLREGTRAMMRSDSGLADVADLRRWEPLPETADELCDVAHDLGVDPKTDLYLGPMATETKIKQLSENGSLAKYKIVHFATHGAVAGQVPRTSEPGLLLTPPDKASETDDGYLTASEIAGLKLDADWVILSACNTAAGGAQDAEALSGLARAFFYSGARSLLVSHWEVNSNSTVKLITKSISELKANPQIGRAEALRRSMESLITTGKDYEAHPAYWAPFVLVGEGGAGR